MKAVSLCSGYGGLDLAVEHVHGAHTAYVADIDADASTVLAHRFPDAPNLGDLTLIDWDDIEPVDILTAGYPCQPFSHAGRRQGEHDERHIWPEVLRAIRALRPGLVVLENVRGHLSLGFGRVLGDLAEAGFDAEWCLLRASDVGAPHGRARVFIVASNTDGARAHVHAEGGASRRATRESGGRPAANTDGVPAWRDGGTDARTEGAHGGRATVNGDRPADGCRAAAHADGEGREGGAGLSGPHPGRRPVPGGCQDWGAYEPAVRRWERILGRAAPVPLNPDNPKQLNARFVEWMMGLPDGWVTDLVPNRRALHTLGNGVVPQQAAAALRMLGGAA